MNGKMSCRQVENALINSALQRKYTRKLDQEFRTTSIAFSAKTAMTTTSSTSTASFVSRFTPTTAKMRMTINGLAVTAVRDG